MLKPHNLLKNIGNNIVEIWLAALLFVGLPYAVYLYTDWRGFIATTIVAQITILILLSRNGEPN